jgi:hypothetical protein
MMIEAWGLRRAELRTIRERLPGDDIQGPLSLGFDLILSPRSGGQFTLRLTGPELDLLRNVLNGTTAPPALALVA